MSQILHFYLKFKFPRASCIFFGKFGSPKLCDSQNEACKSWHESSASPPAKHTHTYTAEALLGPVPSLQEKGPRLGFTPVCRSAPGPAKIRREHL